MVVLLLGLVRWILDGETSKFFYVMNIELHQRLLMKKKDSSTADIHITKLDFPAVMQTAPILIYELRTLELNELTMLMIQWSGYSRDELLSLDPFSARLYNNLYRTIFSVLPVLLFSLLSHRVYP